MSSADGHSNVNNFTNVFKFEFNKNLICLVALVREHV